MDKQVHRERWRLLHQVVRLLEFPMMILGLAWLVLLSIDMVRGLQGKLAIFSEVIWILFGLDFALELLCSGRAPLFPTARKAIDEQLYYRVSRANVDEREGSGKPDALGG